MCYNFIHSSVFIMKSKLKNKALALRKKGLTYSEILKQVPVAKSTLSLWLKDVGLSKPQKQKITKKRLEAGKRGGEAKRRQRIEKTKKIQEKAIKDVGTISQREFWLMGTMLYWAEGSKEKRYRTGGLMDFSNSDPEMIKFYILWLTEILKVSRDRLRFGIYIHENSRNKVKDVVKFWARTTGFSENKFDYIYFKKHNPKTIRKNTGVSYYGTLRVRVSKSTDLCRKVMGWVRGVCEKI